LDLSDVKTDFEKNSDKDSKPPKNRSSDEVRRQLIETIRQRFSKAGPEEKKAIQERLWNMIQYAIARHDYFDDYRTRYLTIATALVSVAGAVVAILVSAKIGLSALGIYASFIVLGGTGVYMFWRFQVETSPNYPYRKVSKVTSWIYFYNLIRNEKLLRESLPESASELREQAAQDYLAGLEKFTTDWSSMNEWEHVQEDIEQVLILFTLQAYKRMFARGMARIFQRGLILFALLLLVGALVYAWCV
jgi:hypothetical protein